MKIDQNLISQLAKLSKLEFTPEELPKIEEDLTKMLAFVEKLNEVNTENVEPLIYMTLGAQNPREDEVESRITQKQALKNAPQKDSDYFRVPKFLSKKD